MGRVKERGTHRRRCKNCTSSFCDGSLKGFAQLRDEARRLVAERRGRRGKKPATPKKDPVTPTKARKLASRPSGQTDKVRRHFSRVRAFKAFAKNEEAIKVRARGTCPCCGLPGKLAEHCHESGRLRSAACAKFNSIEREAVRDARDHFGLTREQGEVSYDDKPCLFRHLHAAGIEYRSGLSYETSYKYVTFAWIEEFQKFIKP